jgi:hypothetical protein
METATKSFLSSNSISNHHNRIVAGAVDDVGKVALDKRATSFFSKGIEVFSPQIEIVEKEGFADFKNNSVKQMLGNIVRCKRGIYIKPVCPHCNKVLTDEGEERAIRISCQNNFCDCEYCIESRKIKAKKRLRSFRIYAKKLIHLIFGFELQLSESKEKKQRREKIVKRIRKECEKRGFKLIGLVARDISEKKTEHHQLYYFHYHLAVYPVKDYRGFMLFVRFLGEKYKGVITTRNEGFKPTKALFNYFAKIMAGQISDKEHHHTTTYSKILSPEDYFKFFYRTNSLRHIGWDRDKLKLRVSHAERSEGVDMFKRLGLSETSKCPFCAGNLTFNNIILKKFIDDPPPPYETQVFMDYGAVYQKGGIDEKAN